MSDAGVARFLERPDRPLSTGEFCRRSRLSMKALRLYDRLGLLRPAYVDESNRYRTYHESQLFTARLILMLRRLDMPLTDVAQVLAAGPDALGLVEQYWARVERRVAVQRDVVAQLRSSLRGEARFTDLAVGERTVPEQIVLTEQRHVHLDELPWIREASARLRDTAQRHGLCAEPQIVIFHGEVTHDSNGPVEVCVPVATPPPDTVDTAWRVELAHREVFTPVVAAQFEMPLILSIYDALHQWITLRGRTEVGAAREVYRPGFDWDATADTDVVCDIAIPVAP